MGAREFQEYREALIAKRFKLYEVTEHLRRPVLEEEKVKELYGEILMPAKAPKRDGKGYEYPAIGHMVGLEGKVTGDRRKLLSMAGF